jgi:hydroxypyruvate isomerase
MGWKLRYASHLGYRSADTPLYLHSVGSLDPSRHVEFAADLGFAGVQYALARTRPVDEQRAVGDALRRRGLEAGCILFAPVQTAVQPLWASSDPDHRQAIVAQIDQAIDCARRIGSRHVAVIGGADPRAPLAWQQLAMVENLKWMADRAEEAGVVLCLESLSRRSLPNMLLSHVGEAYAVAKAVNSRAVRLIFDTSHVQIMDGDLLANLDACWDLIAIVQLADNPGRLEPGTGELNFPNILRRLVDRQFKGLVELEHGWSTPDATTETRGIEWLRDVDARL